MIWPHVCLPLPPCLSVSLSLSSCIPACLRALTSLIVTDKQVAKDELEVVKSSLASSTFLQSLVFGDANTLKKDEALQAKLLEQGTAFEKQMQVCEKAVQKAHAVTAAYPTA